MNITGRPRSSAPLGFDPRTHRAPQFLGDITEAKHNIRSACRHSLIGELVADNGRTGRNRIEGPIPRKALSPSASSTRFVGGVCASRLVWLSGMTNVVDQSAGVR